MDFSAYLEVMVYGDYLALLQTRRGDGGDLKLLLIPRVRLPRHDVLVLTFIYLSHAYLSLTFRMVYHFLLKSEQGLHEVMV